MKREHRLKKRAAFTYVYTRGERTGSRPLLLLSARSTEGLKVGLSVSKKVGKAVVRNRVKRLLREAVSAIEERIDSSRMYVIVAHSSAAAMDYAEACAEVEKIFSRAGRLSEEE